MDAETGQELLKQREVMSRVLADSVVGQLIEAGFQPGQLIDFASEVVRCVTERGIAGNAERASEGAARGEAQVRPVEWLVEPVANDTHRVHGARVTLRALAPADRPVLEKWLQDAEIQKTFSRPLLIHLIDHLPEVPDDPRRRDFVVSDASGRDVGLVCLFNIDPVVGQAEMAKLLGEPGVRGKGYAAEASRLLLAYAVDVLKLRRVYLRTAGFNLHNIKLNEKMGFKFEGILRQSEVLNDRHVHVVLMSMLAEEFLERYRLERLSRPTDAS